MCYATRTDFWKFKWLCRTAFFQLMVKFRSCPSLFSRTTLLIGFESKLRYSFILTPCYFRLAANKVELSHVQPLRDRIPMHVLNSRKKDPAVDKLNVIEERLAIQQRMFEKRKKIASVIPQVTLF